MPTEETPVRVAVTSVCVDVPTCRILSHLIAGKSGAVNQGNLDRYAGVEREVGRLLNPGRIRVCVIDYDQNPNEAASLTERLHSEYPEVCIFALSSNSDPERII